MAHRRTYSITFTLALAMGALVAIGILVVLALGLNSAQRNTASLLREWAITTVTSAGDLIELEMAPARHQVEYVRDMIALGRLNPTNRRQMTDVMLGAMAAAPQIGSLTFVDSELRILAVRRGLDQPPMVVSEDWSDVPGVREQVERARRGKVAVWGELIPALDERSGSLVNLRLPVFVDDEFVGGLVVAVSVSQLSRFVDELGSQVGGNVFVLYGEDFVLAHRLLRGGFKRKTPFHVVPELADIGDPVLASIWDRSNRTVLTEAIAGNRGELERRGIGAHVQNISGVDYLFLYRRTDEFGATPWYVGTYVAMTGFQDELTRLLGAMAAGLVVLLMAVGAAIVIGRRMARPIQRVANAANLVSGFQFDQVAPLPLSRIREIDDQSRAFNSMITGLHWFQNYVPRRLVKRLMEEGGSRESFRSVRRTVTVMFTDIAGFTTQSEDMPADQVADFLNDHFRLTAACVEAERGTIDKYIGDGMMAFWGAPGHQADHAERAFRAAMAITRAVRDDNAQRRARGLTAIRMRLGLHTGDVVVGNIGSPGRVNYTIVGDAVNVGQRLEQLGKEVVSPGEDVVVLLSEDTAKLLPPGVAPLEPVGERRVKGREQPLLVYRLL